MKHVIAGSTFLVLLAITAALADPLGGVGESTRGELSGPYRHDNLTIFLIHGEDTVDASDLVTLDEALERGLVTVHETGNVGELAIENHSDVGVFIQAGDIVKGGRQDRTLAHDVVVPPHSDRLPLRSFCVEAGRWRPRGGEDAGEFSSSSRMLASRDLKLAAKERGDQSRVWASVARTQHALGQKLGAEVRSEVSETSLQLTLEGADVERAVAEYTAALAPIIDEREDVVGFAFAINGEINSIDVYAANEIFRRLWRKALDAAVVEAIAERGQGAADGMVSEAQVEALMAEADGSGEEREEAVTDEVKVKTRSSEEAVVFETRDEGRGGAVLHRNYIKRVEPEAETEAGREDRPQQQRFQRR